MGWDASETACALCFPPHALGFAEQLFLSSTDRSLLTRLIRKVFLCMLRSRASPTSDPFSLVFSTATAFPSGTPGLARPYLPTRGFTARMGEDEVQFCVPCGSAGFVLLCLQATSHPWPTAPGLWATGHMGGVPKREANQLRFLPTVGKAS